jgi:hypothetical protein
MGTSKSDVWAMLHTTTKVLKSNKAIWQNDPVFVAAVAAFDSGVSDIQEKKNELAKLSVKTQTKEKAATFVKLETQALFVVNRIRSYATVIENESLLNTMSFSKTVFETEHDDLVIADVNAIITTAQQYSTQLLPYAVTAEIIAQLQAQLQAYSTICSAPHEIILQIKALNEKLNQSFISTLYILKKRLDLDIEVFKSIAPDFYDQYNKARVIQANNASPSSVIANIKAKDTNESLAGVRCEFTIQGSAKPIIVKESSIKGGFRIQHLTEDKYMVKVSKIGYKDQNTMIIVTQGETTTLTIVMEKE